MSIPCVEPQRAAVGDSLQWDRHLPAYPSADGWTVAYAIRGAGSAGLEIDAGYVTAAGDTYQVRVAGSDTVDLHPGTYRLAGWATRGNDRHTIYTGTLILTPDFATAGAAPSLGRDEELLEILEAAVAGRLTSEVAEKYSIDGVSIERMPMAQITRMLGEVRARVRRQRTGKVTRTWKVRHGR